MHFDQVKTFVLRKLEELSPILSYHSKAHTLDVLASMEQILAHEKIHGNDRVLLYTAVLFHDLGFLEIYQHHEERGCVYARRWLEDFEYSKEEIDVVCGMIMATKIPHQPQTKLEELMCDADLDYLGRDDYPKISNYLKQEWLNLNLVGDNNDWLNKQISFLKMHKFYSSYSISNRRPKKLQWLNDLTEQLA